VNGDLYYDLIVGAHHETLGTVYVFSGKEGSLLYRINKIGGVKAIGYSVSGAGDINGDGFHDFLIGAPGFRPAFGKVLLYSGIDGTLIRRFESEALNDFFGTKVSRAGDVNGDDIPDIIISAPAAHVEGKTVGSAFVFSGADPLSLRW
jgi:hypothetical protein